VIYGDNEYEAILAAKDAEIEELKRELSSAEESLAAQEKKFEDCPHPKGPEYWPCGCSYDKPSHVCAVHAPQLKAAQAEIASLKAQLAALSWKPITSDSLPKVGDEVACFVESGECVIYEVNDFHALFDAQKWTHEYGMTHYRPINPPQAATEGQ
jgi:hypothetical protein